MRYLALALLICTGLFTNAATVDTVITFSPSMKKNIKAVVIKPEGYAKATQLPVVYLFHGHGGDYSNWIKNVPAVARYADQMNILIVCPDGNVNSWYGVDDFFYAVNNKLHEKLLYSNISHDYLVRPGAHDWNYWANAVHYQLIFMSRFFYKD